MFGFKNNLFTIKIIKGDVIVFKKSCHILIASIPLRFTLRLQHGQRMVITQGLTIHNYVNVISDVWKTIAIYQ